MGGVLDRKVVEIIVVLVWFSSGGFGFSSRVVRRDSHPGLDFTVK